MNFKKLLKGPAVWIILAAFIFMLGSSLSSGSEFKQVDTSKGLSLIADGKASAVKVYEGEKRVDVTLKSADAELGKRLFDKPPEGDAALRETSAPVRFAKLLAALGLGLGLCLGWLIARRFMIRRCGPRAGIAEKGGAACT